MPSPPRRLSNFCEEASRETDAYKLLALTEKINRRLEEGEKRTKPSAA